MSDMALTRIGAAEKHDNLKIYALSSGQPQVVEFLIHTISPPARLLSWAERAPIAPLQLGSRNEICSTIGKYRNLEGKAARFKFSSKND